MKHTLNLLIIHYNNPQALERSLTSFIKHGIDPNYIHVFDNASNAQNKHKLLELKLFYQFNCFLSDINLGWGKAINRFVASRCWSEKDILGISAHDSLLKKADWSVIDDEFSDEKVLFICPQYPTPLQCEFSLARSFKCKPVTEASRIETVVGHATLCIARPNIIKQLRFDESCFIYGCESEIFLRAHDASYKTIVTNRIVVENPITDSTSDFCTLAFGINSVYIAKIRHGLFGYLSRIIVLTISALCLAIKGKQAESAIKRKALLFSLRSGGAGFYEYLQLKR